MTWPALPYPPMRSLADVEAIERRPIESYIDIWNSFDLIARAAAQQPDKIALHYLEHGDADQPPVSVTYGEFRRRLFAAANLFHSLGVKTDDAVAYLLPNVPETLDVLWGAQGAGVAGPVNWMLEPRQIVEILRATQPKVLVALGPTPGYEIWDKIAAIRPDLPGDLTVLQVAGPGGTIAGADSYVALRDAQPGDALVSGRRIDPEDIAVYLHTGGTTGSPKVARQPHRGFAYHCWANCLAKGLTRDDVLMQSGPLFHAGGIVTETLSILGLGMTMVNVGPMGFRNRKALKDYWRIVERFGVTMLSGVPTILGVLADNPPTSEEISRIRPFMGTGSGALPAELGRKVERMLGVRALVTYGATEFTCNITMAPRDGEPRYGSSGIRWPFSQVKTVVLDADGAYLRDCAPGEIGAIVVKGPGVIPGYLQEAFNARLFVADGWLNNGDLGRMDEDGYLWITGRAKDVIIRGGHNIDPRVIEETLIAHPAVALAAALGKPDAYAGELPVAYVQLKEGASAGEDELRDFARAHVPERAAAPVELHVVEAIPLTEVGKIFKPALRRDAAGRVYAERLAQAGIAATVEVADDPARGPVATVTCADIADAAARIRDILGAYPVTVDIADAGQREGTKPCRTPTRSSSPAPSPAPRRRRGPTRTSR